MVFSDAVMQERLPKDIYRALKKTDLPNIPDLCIETEYEESLQAVVRCELK